jgi:hypothetical protein
MGKSGLVVGLGVVIALLLAAPCAEAAANKTGWWVRVEKKQTEGSISFQIGTTRKDRHVWLTWQRGDDTEIDVPEELLQVGTLYLQAIANPDESDSQFCVFYKDKGVLEFDFDDQQDDRMKQTDRDRSCK